MLRYSLKSIYIDAINLGIAKLRKCYPKTGVLNYENHIISSIEVAIESLKN